MLTHLKVVKEHHKSIKKILQTPYSPVLHSSFLSVDSAVFRVLGLSVKVGVKQRWRTTLFGCPSVESIKVLHRITEPYQKGFPIKPLIIKLPLKGPLKIV